MAKETSSFTQNLKMSRFSMAKSTSKSKQSLATTPSSRPKRQILSETCTLTKLPETSMQTWPLPLKLSLLKFRKLLNQAKLSLSLFTLPPFTLIKSSSQIPTAPGLKREFKRELSNKKISKPFLSYSKFLFFRKNFSYRKTIYYL